MLTSNLYFIGQSEHLQLVDIVKQAHKLSFKLQHGFVRSRHDFKQRPRHVHIWVGKALRDRTYGFIGSEGDNDQ
jgi:hypothetical protein